MNLEKKTLLTALFGLQVACVIYLIFDSLADILLLETVMLGPVHEIFEHVIVFALITSLIYTGSEFRAILHRNDKIENQLKAASGAFSDLLAEHFDDWQLTNSERDVALLAIKGLGISEIADIRDTKEGTIKAQLNAIYRKAKVTGRPQLISLFVEELMGNALDGKMAERPA